MNRIYLSLSIEQLKSLDKGRYYLSYLQIRSQARNQAGGFYFKQFCEVVRLQPRAAKFHINALLEKGFIISQGNGHYRVINQKLLAGYGRRFLVYTICDKELMSFHSSRIADFRAFISELEYERYKRHQKGLIKGYTITNDEGFVERRKNPSLRAWDNKLALSCAESLTSLRTATVSKYRKRQKIARYKWELTIIKQSRTKKHSSGKSSVLSDFEGFVIPTKDGCLIHSPIAVRTSKIGIKRVSCS